MFAYDYPLLGLFWTTLWIFIWVAWIVLLFRVFADIFRSHDLGGFAKACWSLFVLLAPFLGVFVYLIARGGHMAEHQVERAQAHEAAFQDQVRTAAGTTSTADELTKLSQLHDQGVLSDEEYGEQKAKILAS